MIPSMYNQFSIEVTKELHDEFYAKMKSGDIRPEVVYSLKHKWNGGPYDNERSWDQDWNWCIDNLDYVFEHGTWPMDHPRKNHIWNTDRVGELNRAMYPDPDDDY